MVMLNLFHQAGYSIAVVHCNFQLRDAESDLDEAFVIGRCEHLQIPCYVKRFDTNNYAWENRLSIQIAARDLRYAWFDEIFSVRGLKYSGNRDGNGKQCGGHRHAVG